MKEAALVRAIIRALALTGWRVCHFRPARTADGWRTAVEGHAGAPDIIAVHPERGVLLIEAKSEEGRLSADQVLWRSASMRAAERYPDGIRYLVVRPQEWLAGELDELLGLGGVR